MKSQIFKLAWQLFKSNLFDSFGEALKAAWIKVKLMIQLRSGIAYFSFRKASGELRDAIGTLSQNNFSYDYKGSNTAEKPYLIKYWDIEKRAFRSFKIQNLVSIG